MGYEGTQLNMAEKRAASRFNQLYPWFVYEGPASENQILKWKAYNPGAFPAPHSEVYQAYAISRYSQEVKDRLMMNGGVMLWGNYGMELVKGDKQLELKLEGKVIATFWYEGGNPESWLRHGDMGTFALFRMGYMVGDVDLEAYLMSEEDKLQDAIDKAVAKMDLPAYRGNAKAFTTDTGFLVLSMDLEPVFNGDVFIGYKSTMNVDWSQQVKTTKPGISIYS